MAPVASPNTTNLDDETSEDGGLSPAIWFVIAVAIIVILCQLMYQAHLGA